MKDVQDNIQTLTRAQILKRLKRQGLTLAAIAERAKCSESYVSRVIARYTPETPNSAKVWAALEEMLHG